MNVFILVENILKHDFVTPEGIVPWIKVYVSLETESRNIGGKASLFVIFEILASS